MLLFTSKQNRIPLRSIWSTNKVSEAAHRIFHEGVQSMLQWNKYKTSKSQRSSNSNNWILMSCQTHRVTSGQSNSGHKQVHVSKLFSHIYQPSVKSVYKTNHFANIKHTCTQTSGTNFQRVSPFNITPVKRAHRARTCWYCLPFSLIYWHQVKKNI